MNSKMEYDYILLGAEKQAAISLACAYPEKKFLFVSEIKEIAGKDFSNIDTIQCALSDQQKIEKFKSVPRIYCSGKWRMESLGRNSETSLFERLSKVNKAVPGIALPQFRTEAECRNLRVIEKGNFWHKPDAVIIHPEGRNVPEVMTQFDGEIFFQKYIPSESHFVSFGRRDAGNSQFGIFKILGESVAREEFIMASETTAHELVQKMTLEVLELLNLNDFFYMNWVQHETNLFLTSVRPEPLGLFASLRHSGIDLLQEGHGFQLAKAGIKSFAEINYSSYSNE